MRTARPSRLAVLCAVLAVAGCHKNARPETPEDDYHRLPPVAVADAGFATAVHKLLRDGKASAERSALLAGTIRRQLAHASEHFARGDSLRGSAAVVGALYLLRLGEMRPDMFDKTSMRALTGTIERFSARGDEGRALALMHMKQRLLPKGSRERRELAAHMGALQRWRKDTRTGGDMAKLSADERAEVGRALLEPSKEALARGHKAVERWIARAVEYNVRYQKTRQLPPRDEVVEAYRALQTGGQTMAALYLRHGRAREAVAAIESSAAARITDPAFFHRLRSAAVDDTAEDWRNLARDLVRGAQGSGDNAVMMDPELFDAALWGIAIEAYRRDPESLAIGHLLANQLLDHGMPEAAPLVLLDAVGTKPSVVALSSATALVADALSEQYDTDTPAVARRIFAASEGVIALADRDGYRAKVRPSAAQLRQLMATVELKSGHVDRARPLLVRALRDEPTVWGYTMLGTLERQIGNLDAALAHATRATELPAAQVLRLDAADAQLLAFEILRDRGANDRAEKALSQALEMVLATRRRPSSPEVEVRAERLLARVLDGYGDRGRARRALERALEIAETHRPILGPTVLSAVGRALVYKNLAAARAALQMGLKAGVENQDLVYGALWLMLLERELGEKPDGKVDRVLQEAIHGSDWTSALARWARGMSDDAELRKAARTHSQRIEAEFYITMLGRAGGQSGATEKLREIAQNPLIDLMEVQIARDILAPKLNAKIPPKFDVP